MTPQEHGCLCQECPFAKGGMPSQPVYPTTPINPRYILVGEGPGESEVTQGRPFVGSTGIRLDKELERVGLERGEAQVINATLCQPPPDVNKKQTIARAVKCCFPFFAKHVDKEKHAFVMGEGAWMAYRGAVDGHHKLPKGLVAKGRGFVRDGKHGRKYIVSHHPTYAFFRAPKELGAWRIDLDRFKRLLRDNLEPLPGLFTNGNAERWMKTYEDKEVACDIETAPVSPDKPYTAKDATRAILKTFGFGNYDQGGSFFYPSMASIPVLLGGKFTIWQNGQWFDHRVLCRYEINVGKYADIRDLARAMSSNSRLSLGYQASIYLDVPPWKDKEDDDKVFETKDPQELMLYNAMDAVFTYRIYKKRMDEIAQMHPREQARILKIYRMNLKLSEKAARMHSIGFLVHAANREKLDKELYEEYIKRERHWRDIANVPDTVDCTPNSMRALLYLSCEKEGLSRFHLQDPIDEDHYTETGEIKVDKASLLAVYTSPVTPDDCKQLIVAYWQAEAVWKTRSSFVVSDKITEAIGDDGRLRAGWNSMGTETGRWSCSEPNLLTLSEEKDE